MEGISSRKRIQLLVLECVWRAEQVELVCLLQPETEKQTHVKRVHPVISNQMRMQQYAHQHEKVFIKIKVASHSNYLAFLERTMIKKLKKIVQIVVSTITHLTRSKPHAKGVVMAKSRIQAVPSA